MFFSLSERAVSKGESGKVGQVLTGLPLFMAPIYKKVDIADNKNVHLSSIDIDYNNDTFSDDKCEERKLVFIGKFIKKAGDKTPFSIFKLIETQQAGLVK